MDFNIDIRKRQLENLDQFISSSRGKLQSFMDQFSWTADKIVEERPYVMCPYNNAHKLLPDKTEDHNLRCMIKSAGYDLEEEFLSEPNIDAKDGRIKIDTIKKIEVLSNALTQTPYFQTAWNGQDPDPLTYSRLITTFSRDERLALYNYSITNSKGPEKVPEFDISSGTGNEKNSSFTEEALMSFERDIKRRSVKYKPIHTNHKNYKEILREVINSQMQQYKDCLAENSGKGPHTPEYCYDKNESEDRNRKDGNSEKPEELSERPHSSVSRVSNHSSSSRSTFKRLDGTLKYSPLNSRNNSKERKRPYHHKEDSSHLKSSVPSRYEYVHNDEDSRESNTSRFSTSQKSENASLSCDKEDILRNHSRDSSVHSSYKSKDTRDNYKHRGKKRKSRSNDREVRKHHRKHRSRSRHKSTERKSHKRDKLSKYRSRRYEKYRETS